MTTENVAKIDAILGVAGDWLRFSGTTWILFSDRSRIEIGSAIRTALTPEDSDLTAAVDPDDLYGWAPGWIEEWIIERTRQQMDQIPTKTIGPPSRR